MALAHAHQSRVPLPAFTNSGHLRVIRNEERSGAPSEDQDAAREGSGEERGPEDAGGCAFAPPHPKDWGRLQRRVH